MNELHFKKLFGHWRLEARKQEEDWRHDLPSGTERWRSVKYLGSGACGEVSQERRVSPSSPAAVRAVKRISKRHPDFLSSRRELEALITFSDISQPQYQQHFVRFFGWFSDSTDLYLSMEFIEHGNLQQHIEQKVFPEPEAASVTTQIARALHYMHQKQFIHRDLKPMNILVSQIGPQWHVKVADFGIAKHTIGTAARTKEVGTHGYMAPELFGPKDSEYTSAIDVWALGAVAFCMRTGSPPFGTYEELLDYSRGRSKFPSRPLGYSSGFCGDFISNCMARGHEDRLNIEQVLAHDWLNMKEMKSEVDVDRSTVSTSSWEGIELNDEWSYTSDNASTVHTDDGSSTPQSSPSTVVSGSGPQSTGQSTESTMTRTTKIPPPSEIWTVKPCSTLVDTTTWDFTEWTASLYFPETLPFLNQRCEMCAAALAHRPPAAGEAGYNCIYRGAAIEVQLDPFYTTYAGGGDS